MKETHSPMSKHTKCRKGHINCHFIRESSTHRTHHQQKQAHHYKTTTSRTPIYPNSHQPSKQSKPLEILATCSSTPIHCSSQCRHGTFQTGSTRRTQDLQGGAGNHHLKRWATLVTVLILWGPRWDVVIRSLQVF